jgi:hypothetical protein
VDRLIVWCGLRVLMLGRYLKEQLGGSVVMREKVWRQLPLFDPERTFDFQSLTGQRINCLTYNVSFFRVSRSTYIYTKSGPDAKFIDMVMILDCEYPKYPTPPSLPRRIYGTHYGRVFPSRFSNDRYCNHFCCT